MNTPHQNLSNIPMPDGYQGVTEGVTQADDLTFHWTNWPHSPGFDNTPREGEWKLIEPDEVGKSIWWFFGIARQIPAATNAAS